MAKFFENFTKTPLISRLKIKNLKRYVSRIGFNDMTIDNIELGIYSFEGEFYSKGSLAQIEDGNRWVSCVLNEKYHYLFRFKREQNEDVTIYSLTQNDINIRDILSEEQLILFRSIMLVIWDLDKTKDPKEIIQIKRLPQ